MQTLGNMLNVLPSLMVFAIGPWILWKFYRALARIGEELSEIKTILRLRLPAPERPPNR